MNRKARDALKLHLKHWQVQVNFGITCGIRHTYSELFQSSSTLQQGDLNHSSLGHSVLSGFYKDP